MKKTKFLLLAGLMCTFSLVFVPLTHAEPTLTEQVNAACSHGDADGLQALVGRGAKFAKKDAEYAMAIFTEQRDKILEMSKRKYEYWDEDATGRQIFNGVAAGQFDDDYLSFLLDNHILTSDSQYFSDIFTTAVFYGYKSSIPKFKEIKPNAKPYLPRSKDSRINYYVQYYKGIMFHTIDDEPLPTPPPEIIDYFLSCGVTPNELLVSFCEFFIWNYNTNNYGHTEFTERLSNNDPYIQKQANYITGIINYLAEKGADFNYNPYGKDSSLLESAIHADPILPYLLLRHGANIHNPSGLSEKVQTSSRVHRYTIRMFKMIETGEQLPASYTEFLNSPINDECCNIL